MGRCGLWGMGVVLRVLGGKMGRVGVKIGGLKVKRRQERGVKMRGGVYKMPKLFTELV